MGIAAVMESGLVEVALVACYYKRDLHEADSFVFLLPTAKAVGYPATAPMGLA